MVVCLCECYVYVNCIKEVGGFCDKVLELVYELGDDVVIFCGDDVLILLFMLVGVQGVVSVIFNLFFKGMVDMVVVVLVNDFVIV